MAGLHAAADAGTVAVWSSNPAIRRRLESHVRRMKCSGVDHLPRNNDIYASVVMSLTL
jgi:hypothetical protein